MIVRDLLIWVLDGIAGARDGGPFRSQWVHVKGRGGVLEHKAYDVPGIVDPEKNEGKGIKQF